jgi:paired amphipathic helix protein Sin3a
LLEDFKQFLPESAAQAKAAAAAKAAEEAQQNQTPQGHGRNEAKMPPVGNFALPASSSKENKKRQRNTAINSASQANAMGESSSRGIAPGAVTNKVRISLSLLAL